MSNAEQSLGQSIRIIPPEFLKPLVRSYYFFDLDATLSYTLPGWTRTMMVIRFGEISHIYFPDGTSVPHLGAGLLAGRSSPIPYGRVTGRYQFIVVEFQPMALQTILRCNLEETAGTEVDASQVFNALEVSCVVERLSASKDIDERATVLSSFLYSNLKGVDFEPKADVSLLLQKIGPDQGALSMSTLRKATSLSERTIRRRVAAYTGLSPRGYYALKRAEYALSMLFHQPNVSLNRIALTSGYYDQAHLIREMKRITLATPGELRQTSDRGLWPLRYMFQ